jgi:predicted dehydrogenase
MTARLRFGLIGAGSIAAYHIDGLRAAGGEVAAIAAGSLASAKKAARTFAIPRACDWGAMMSGGGLDAVIVATPDDTHEAIAAAAIDAGIPCLVQKPLAHESGAALRILRRAQQRGSFLGTSFMHRHFPEVRALQAMLAGPDALKDHGRILSIRLRNATPGPDWSGWFYDPARTGGVLLQLGVHGFDLIEHLFGPIERLGALTAIRMPERRLADGSLIAVRAPDHALVHHELRSGVPVSHEILFGEVAGTSRFRLELTCEKAQVELRGPHGALAIYAGDGWRELPTDGEDAGTAQHRRLIADLARGLAGDGTGPAGVQTVLVAEAVARAAAEGRMIAVPRFAEEGSS